MNIIMLFTDYIELFDVISNRLHPAHRTFLARTCKSFHKYLYRNTVDKQMITNNILFFVENGESMCLDYILSGQTYPEYLIYCHAIKSNKISILEWLYDHDYKFENDRTHIFGTAAELDNLDIIRWALFDKNILPYSFVENIVYPACEKNSMTVLMWASHYSVFPWIEALHIALKNNHAELFNWILENKDKWYNIVPENRSSLKNIKMMAVTFGRYNFVDTLKLHLFSE